MKITMDDIYKRTRIRNIRDHSEFNINEMRLYTNNGVFIENNAFHMLYHWEDFNEDTNIAFSKALDVFVEICNNCNDSVINDAGRFLVSEVSKVRDAQQLQNSIKYKTSRLKTKIITKLQNKFDDASDNLTNSISKVQNNLKSPLGGGGGSTPTSGSDTSNGDETTSDTNGVANECFNMLLNESKIMAECNRLVNNYNKICKRFDIDKLVSEVYNEDDIYHCINEICECVDTYNISFVKKYNTALETVFYVFNKNYLQYPSDKIIEAVTDHYIFNIPINEAELVSIEYVLKHNVLFESADFDCIKYLFKESDSTDAGINVLNEEYNVNLGSVLENENLDQIKDDAKSIRKDVKQWPKGNPHEHEDDDIKKMIEDFRAQCAKSDKDDNKNMLVTHFKSLINKIYTKNPDQIVNEVPKFFSIIRAFFLISTCAISVVLGIVASITSLILKVELERKQLEKIINAYQKEIEAVDKKLEKTKDDYAKERLEKYKKELKNDLQKIKEYQDNLYSDEENDKRHDAEDSSYDFDDDFDFDWDDDFDEFDEAMINNFATISLISELVSNISEATTEDVDGMVANNIYKFDNDDIDAVTDFSITVPTILEKSKLKRTLESYRDELRSYNTLAATDYMRIDCLNDNIYKLSESSHTYNTNSDTKSIICTLLWINEMTKMQTEGYVNEMNITNTLKLALNRLKNNAIKLSDKEKQMSNTIDVSVNNVSKNIEKAMVDSSRESIIKGSILPSASKTIKMALVLGVEWAINPAIAVITAVGAFACQKTLTAKERQIVLDDIEIELKMCERYMRQAEDKNDMKAIRQIEQVQRNLLRQQQRIKYRMKVVYKQSVPNTVGEDD